MKLYLLGLVTLPALALAGLVSLGAYWWIQAYLERRWGLAWEGSWRRKVDEISDYMLRHNIWWERQFGPVFAGGWWRHERGADRINRWIGLGRPGGPCLMFFRKRILSAAPEEFR